MNRSVVLNQSGSAPEDNAEALKQVTQFMRRSYAKDSATGKAQCYNAWEGLIEKMMPLCKGMMTLTVQVKARDIDCVPQAVLAK